MKKDKNAKPRIVAVASIGGHWIQLLRIARGLGDTFDITYCSTESKCASMVPDAPFFVIRDFSRWNAYRLIPNLFRLTWRFLRHRPRAVITTGAAPGLTALLAARLLGIKTIWIDSIANVECLSMSGRIASKFASRVYTQWPELQNEKTVYAGNVLGHNKQ